MFSAFPTESRLACRGRAASGTHDFSRSGGFHDESASFSPLLRGKRLYRSSPSALAQGIGAQGADVRSTVHPIVTWPRESAMEVPWKRVIARSRVPLYRAAE